MADFLQTVDTDGGSREPLPVTLVSGGAEVNLSALSGGATSAQTGAVDETAPASDTASSGLNGRLQRIAQRLTSILAVFSNSFANVTTATTVTIKGGAGTLHTITINSLGTVASAVVVYDNTAGSGTKIATINSLSVLGTLTFDVAFATGLTLVTTGTVAPDVTVSYR